MKLHALASLALAAALYSPLSAAATVELDVNLASYHTQQWARQQLNQQNPGLGVTYRTSRTWAASVGAYKNSYWRPTVYALVEWTPIQFGHRSGWQVDAGMATGLIFGYRRDEIPCAPLAGAALIRVRSPRGIGWDLFGTPNFGARQSGFIGVRASLPLGK